MCSAGVVVTTKSATSVSISEAEGKSEAVAREISDGKSDVGKCAHAGGVHRVGVDVCAARLRDVRRRANCYADAAALRIEHAQRGSKALAGNALFDAARIDRIRVRLK